jgi:hypothetical protein
MTEARYISTHGGAYPDVEIEQTGGLFLVHPLTDTGAAWIGKNVDTDAATFWLSALVVEHRYIEQLAAGMIEDGLVVKNQGRKLIVESM